ncbi:unnamed protein product [Oikopleura dioica]|uniref:Homeobox domain-containing protein n=1 Tax=Oikopleura dioica TaxID=34765 RepID=E4YQ15_OIKDI|nr:unnamed protein product [Oikopleura dioica]
MISTLLNVNYGHCLRPVFTNSGGSQLRRPRGFRRLTQIMSVGSRYSERRKCPIDLDKMGMGVPQVNPMMAAQYGYAQLMQAQSTRKNATRESTQQLKAWLKDHQKNPYPTKGEKIMLALVSGMSLTQVSTWFANARRRLKKENKWCPEGGSEDNDGSDSGSVTAEDSASSIEQRVPVISVTDESGYSSSDRDTGSPPACTVPVAPPALFSSSLLPSFAAAVPLPRYMPRSLETSPVAPQKRKAGSLWSIADITGSS